MVSGESGSTNGKKAQKITAETLKKRLKKRLTREDNKLHVDGKTTQALNNNIIIIIIIIII